MSVSIRASSAAVSRASALAIGGEAGVGVGGANGEDEVETRLNEPLGGGVEREPRRRDAARPLPQHLDRPPQRRLELLGSDRQAAARAPGW